MDKGTGRKTYLSWDEGGKQIVIRAQSTIQLTLLFASFVVFCFFDKSIANQPPAKAESCHFGNSGQRSATGQKSTITTNELRIMPKKKRSLNFLGGEDLERAVKNSKN